MNVRHHGVGAPILNFCFVAVVLGLSSAVYAEPPKYEPATAELVRSRDGLGKVLQKLRTGGQVTVTVDGKVRERPVERFDSYCTYHHIATLSLAENLELGSIHTVEIKIHPDQPDR